jgi:hypothetical protein
MVRFCALRECGEIPQGGNYEISEFGGRSFGYIKPAVRIATLSRRSGPSRQLTHQLMRTSFEP